ncbi:MAG: hypothetical protein ACRD0U_06815 [Acidimicrobiales bacterium]
MIQLVDDQLLGRILRGDEPPKRDAEIFTTGYWYMRLCQAVLGASDRTGVLSAPFAALRPDARARALRGLLELPDTIGLLSLRELGPLIGQLRERHDLNILGMEALAAATRLEAEVFLSAPSPRLEGALQAEGRPVTLRQ